MQSVDKLKWKLNINLIIWGDDNWWRICFYFDFIFDRLCQRFSPDYAPHKTQLTLAHTCAPIRPLPLLQPSYLLYFSTYFAPFNLEFWNPVYYNKRQKFIRGGLMYETRYNLTQINTYLFQNIKVLMFKLCSVLSWHRLM